MDTLDHKTQPDILGEVDNFNIKMDDDPIQNSIDHGGERSGVKEIVFACALCKYKTKHKSGLKQHEGSKHKGIRYSMINVDL